MSMAGPGAGLKPDFEASLIAVSEELLVLEIYKYN
jgi:hypothetical protein